MIKLSKDRLKIENVKFMNFFYTTFLKDVDRFQIPDRIDHLPPDMNQHLLRTNRFWSHFRDDFDLKSSEEKLKL